MMKRAFLKITVALFAIFFIGCLSIKPRHQPEIKNKDMPMPSIAEVRRIIKAHVKKISPDDNMSAYREMWSEAQSDLMRHLPTVNGHDLEACTAHLIKKALNVDEVIFNDHRKKNGAMGLSGFPILFAHHQGKPIAAIKAFPIMSNFFAQEFWSQDSLHQQGISTPSIIAVSLCQTKTAKYFLLASEFVEGILLSDAIVDLTQLPAGEKRDEKASGLATIMEKLGAGLGKLHTQAPPIYGTRTRHLIESHDEVLDKALQELKIDPDGQNLDMKALTAFIKPIMRDNYYHQYRYAWMHGDAHPGNFLYDAEHDRIVMLDVADGAFSMGAQFEPRGAPLMDYMKLVSSLRVRQSFGVTCKEYLYLKDAFDRGYEKAGARLPERGIEDFYTLIEVFSYFDWYFKHRSNLPNEAQGPMREIFLTGLSWLKYALTDDKSVSEDDCSLAVRPQQI